MVGGIKMKQISDATRQAIARVIQIENLKGNKFFKDIWIGNGWLKKDKDGKITFTPTKQLPY